MRKNGWQLPSHPLQVVAVAVFLALGFAFYVFFCPICKEELVSVYCDGALHFSCMVCMKPYMVISFNGGGTFQEARQSYAILFLNIVICIFQFVV